MRDPHCMKKCWYSPDYGEVNPQLLAAFCLDLLTSDRETSGCIKTKRNHQNTLRAFCEVDLMIPVTHGYVRVSNSARDKKNLETQLRRPLEAGVQRHRLGRTTQRQGWQLMDRVQDGDTIVVSWLDWFSRNFDEGVRIQADLTKQNIGIVAIREDINTAQDSAAVKLYCRIM